MGTTVTVKISDDVRKILSVCTIGEDFVRLPAGQLDRDTYTAVDKALKAMGGKWNRGRKVHVFKDDPREALQTVTGGGDLVDKKKTLQAFYTPDAVADRLVDLAAANFEGGPNFVNPRILEPSAGGGAIVRAIRRRFEEAHITAIDLDAYSEARLSDLADADQTWTEIDFLTIKPEDEIMNLDGFDAVLMNPPFSKGQDIAHVTHAWSFVRPGGLLAAIVSPSFQTREDKAHTAFRELHRQYAVDGEEVPAGAFKKSGTNVRTVMIVWRKPAE